GTCRTLLRRRSADHQEPSPRRRYAVTDRSRAYHCWTPHAERLALHAYGSASHSGSIARSWRLARADRPPYRPRHRSCCHVQKGIPQKTFEQVLTLSRNSITDISAFKRFLGFRTGQFLLSLPDRQFALEGCAVLGNRFRLNRRLHFGPDALYFRLLFAVC